MQKVERERRSGQDVMRRVQDIMKRGQEIRRRGQEVRRRGHIFFSQVVQGAEVQKCQKKTETTRKC